MQSMRVFACRIRCLSNGSLDDWFVDSLRISGIADDLLIATKEGFTVSGYRGGPFEPSAKVYRLENQGPEALGWTASWSQPWLTVTPARTGTLLPQATLDVNVHVNEGGTSLDWGTYSDTVTFQNVGSGRVSLYPVELSVCLADAYTERFTGTACDLQKRMIAFVPDGSGAYYQAYQESEQVDEFEIGVNQLTLVPLGDDDYAEFLFSDGKQFVFYGQAYDRLYLNSNGSITFGQGDNGYAASLQNHFSLPRISGCLADLTPNDTVYFAQLEDRIVVTFDGTPRYGQKTPLNRFQIELFFTDQTIRMTWLAVSPGDVVVGLSEGKGVPLTISDSDMSEALPPCPYCDMNGDSLVNLSDFAGLADSWMSSVCVVPYWCGGADVDRSGMVEPGDLVEFGHQWLTDANPVEWIDPISAWHLDFSGNNIAVDAFGNNHGTIHGAISTPAVISNGIQFDRVDDYVDLGNSSSLKPVLPITICTWVYFEPTDSNSPIISLDSGPTEQYGISLELTKDKRIRVSYGDGGTDLSSSRSRTGLSTLQTDIWYHIAATVRSETQMDLYVNGRNDAGIYAGNGGNLAYSNHNSYLGTRTGINFFKGVIDEVAVYDRSLSPKRSYRLYLTD